eukprot:126709_1
MARNGRDIFGVRFLWQVNDRCRIYSEKKKKCFKGTIEDITTDIEGQWIHVSYDNRTIVRQVQRLSDSIKPFPPIDLILAVSVMNNEYLDQFYLLKFLSKSIRYLITGFLSEMNVNT